MGRMVRDAPYGLRTFFRNFGPFGIYFPTPTRRHDGSDVDVILIQGFFTGGRAMRWVAETLEQDGLRCAVPKAGGFLRYLQTRRIEQAGAAVAKAISELPEDRKVYIVGHSMGGIVARWAIQVAGATRRVAGVVTLGSPHQGTPMGVAGGVIGLWAISSAPFQLAPRSRILADLNRLPWPKHIPMTAISSRSDLLCIRPGGEVPFADGALVKNIVLEGYGHTELIYKPEILSMVRDAIRGFQAGHQGVQTASSLA